MKVQYQIQSFLKRGIVDTAIENKIDLLLIIAHDFQLSFTELAWIIFLVLIVYSILLR